jgi:DegV family protein with EDD domain
VPVRIVTDSACDLPQALADELGIVIVPLSIRFGAEEFVDRQDLSVAEFWRRSKASAVLPSTAAPSPGAFEVAYRTLKDQGATGVVVVSLSGELSATIQSAQLAARAVADDISVTVVDSRSVTIGQGMIAVAAARRAAQGASEAEVAALVTSLAERTQVWGALDTLENLKKGGRIGNAKALLASVLSIKPIIEIRHGKVEEGGKQRTRSKAMAFLVEKVRSEIASRGSIENLAVVHAATTDVDAVVAQLQAIYPHPIVIGDIGPVIGSHAGTGTIAVVFQVPAA